MGVGCRKLHVGSSCFDDEVVGAIYESVNLCSAGSFAIVHLISCSEHVVLGGGENDAIHPNPNFDNCRVLASVQRCGKERRRTTVPPHLAVGYVPRYANFPGDGGERLDDGLHLSFACIERNIVFRFAAELNVEGGASSDVAG